MDLANWIYLATGLGVGLASRWLLPPKLSTDLKGIPPQQLDGVLPQTQLAYLMAQQISQFKGGFLARTSHELRSPLSNIIGLHQLILSDLCDDRDEERQFVAQAHEAALQLVKLIDEILNVARLEHGTNKLEIQPLQLSFVLEEVCNILRMIAANRSHRLQLSSPPPEIYVLADPLWLRQIILSLIDAAIFCIEDGGIFYLSVQLIPESNFVYIWIDAPLAVSIWNDPVDLLQGDFSCEASLIAKSALNISSPGLTLLLVQTSLEVMQGKLEIFPAPTNSETSPTTRMQISIPLLTPDTALLEIEP
ncbi:sensor histidine kinase [Chlorogloea sp. CCALA 695]|uniref:sensor histidine kinase n=1 Tax=Chlorogloea sp. CCALA 695 TaxID=2107693 RepID=UPI000D04BBD1|nr:sensor histidine kinase [Chlorogloea sp. CCALA 695]PSB34055.1 sensor histidine kinase [Chlorogloea sp. CCALA 695]